MQNTVTERLAEVPIIYFDLNKISFFLLFSFLIAVTQSCYSPEDGCLDPEATNYSITADNMCESCCTYPTMDVSVFHQNDTVTFNLGDTIYDGNEEPFILLDFVFFLSNFAMYTDDGSILTVSDTLQLDKDASSIFVQDDVIRVERGTFKYEVGQFIYDGKLSKIEFQVGLNDDLNKCRFTESVSGHPLTNDPDSLFQDDIGEFVFQRLQIARGPMMGDTIILDIEEISSIASIEIDVDSERGADKNIIIEARYNEWFQGIDILNMSNDEIEAILLENSSEIFYLRE